MKQLLYQFLRGLKALKVKANDLQKGDYEIIKSMADAIVTLSQALDNKATSIKRLLAMLFGPKTEKKDKCKINGVRVGFRAGCSLIGVKYDHLFKYDLFV